MHEYVPWHFVAIILACFIASMKNRSVLGWFLLSFFFGWFATFIVACLRVLPRYR